PQECPHHDRVASQPCLREAARPRAGFAAARARPAARNDPRDAAPAHSRAALRGPALSRARGRARALRASAAAVRLVGPRPRGGGDRSRLGGSGREAAGAAGAPARARLTRVPAARRVASGELRQRLLPGRNTREWLPKYPGSHLVPDTAV